MEARQALRWSQSLGLADGRFPCAEHQAAIGRHGQRQPVERSPTDGTVEIEQDIAAQDQVEGGGFGGGVKDVVNFEAHHAAQLIARTPAGA